MTSVEGPVAQNQTRDSRTGAVCGLGLLDTFMGTAVSGPLQSAGHWWAASEKDGLQVPRLTFEKWELEPYCGPSPTVPSYLLPAPHKGEETCSWGDRPEGRTGWRPQMALGAFLRQESVTAVGQSLHRV